MDTLAIARETLVVDDDPFVLKLLDRQLRQLGCKDIALCDNASHALALIEARGERIDLVFCDLQMPDLDGVEFVRHLASLDYRGSLVLVSGEDERVLQTVRKLAEAHHINMLAALSKPVSSDRLRSVLDARAASATPDSALHEEARSADELGEGIASGQLLNHYQPKVALASGRLIGVEALVRWQHPRLGLLYPDRFIGTAEEHGLIDALARGVLTAALGEMPRWERQGLDLQVSVNVSMDNMASLDFPDTVTQLATAAGVSASRLTLEVTETRLMKDPRAALDILTRLRLKRIGLSIDDFGTGHSSLAQLRDVPFDELKLDRGFVHGAHADPARRVIVETILSMTRGLGLRSVAEGVEVRADWDVLRSLGCDVAQGYFIGRPMPADSLASWHDEWLSRYDDLAGAV